MPSKPTAPAAAPEPNPWPRSARNTAWIALGFCLVVLVLLAVNYAQSRRLYPLNSVELTALKAQLVQNPLDEGLKGKVRAYDLELRRSLARHRELGESGGGLLLAGMAVFVLAIKYGYYKKKLARPDKKPIVVSNQVGEIRHALASVGVLAALTVGVAYVASSQSGTQIAAPVQAKAAVEAATATAPKQPAPPATPYPTPEEMAKNWPRFRGPGGNAVAAHTNYPAAWDVAKGDGIAWKIAIPAPGAGSPVTWDNRLFITGANAKKREVYCYDVPTGKLLWQKSVETGAPPNTEAPNVMEESGGFAPSTAATDGRRVYVIFVTGDLAAFDMEGNPVWKRYLGRPDNTYGHAASLDLYQNRLIVQLDQGDGKDGKSKLLALDTATGQNVWESQPRPVPNSWSTPITFKAGARDLLLACGNPWVMAYDPAKGTEVWRAKLLYGEVTPSPISSAGLVFTVMDGEKLCAIKPDGAGDVTKTHVAWSADEGLPDITSPVADGKFVYLVTSSGAFTCYEIASGKKAYSQELDQSFKSSPSVVGDRILMITDKGTAIWAQAGAQFKELGRAEFADEVLASPAFLDGRFIVRGRTNLVCIGRK